MKKLYSTLLIITCCVSLSFSQPYDFGITAIVEPANGASIDQNFNDTMRITVFNFGPDLQSTDSVVLRMLVDGTPTNIIYYLVPGLPFPSTFGFTIGWPVDFGTLGDLNTPLTPGSHSICWTIYMGSLDTNSANDTTCVTYTITVTGIESILGMKSNIFLSNGRLNVDVTNPNIVGTTELTVYNMAGTLIYNETISGDGHVVSMVDLSSHATGMYIVRLLSGNKLIESRKLMK